MFLVLGVGFLRPLCARLCVLVAPWRVWHVGREITLCHVYGVGRLGVDGGSV